MQEKCYFSTARLLKPFGNNVSHEKYTQKSLLQTAFRITDPSGGKMVEKVSVIVPTKNCRDTISPLLDSLQNQELNYAQHEVEIIVVDSSDDGTDGIVEKRKGLKLVRMSVLGLNVARNVGLSKSTGDIVCFIDGDYVAPPNWISNILSEFEKDQRVGSVGGSVYTFPTNLIGKYLNETLISPNPRYKCRTYLTNEHLLRQPYGDVRLPIGGNLAFRRSVFKDVGYFDEDWKIGGWDEFELMDRLLQHGYKLVASPKAFVCRQPPSSLRELVKSFYRYGKGAKTFEKKTKLRVERVVEDNKMKSLTRKFLSTVMHSLQVSKKERSLRGILYFFLDILLGLAYVLGRG
jgi:glycosyltransferase involved in cell wall biosynthesis